MKGNRAALLTACRTAAEGESLSAYESEERTRGRTVRRRVETYAPPGRLPTGWPPTGRVIRVERSGTRDGRAYRREGFYLTSRADDAEALAGVIRAHWLVENRLHWCKDAVMNEDRGRVRDGAGAAILSLLRGLALSLLRHAGFASPTDAFARLANRVPELLRLLKT
nr:ISAs1 family transposase [Alienimonas chondri]